MLGRWSSRYTSNVTTPTSKLSRRKRCWMKNPGLTVSTSEDTRRPSFSAPSMSSPPPVPVLQGAAIRKSCASQRCLSPSSTVSTSLSTGGARDSVASPRGSPALRSPSLTTRSAREAPSSPSSTGSIGSATKSPTSPTSPTGAGKPMSMETYFRLLKKAQVLEKLLSMNSHLHSSEEQLRKLQTEKAKTDTVQQRVFVELEAYQKQYVDVQRFFLELLESMTLLCLKEEQLQLGSSADTALRHAELAAEEKTLQDLQDATLAIGRTKPSNGGLCSSPMTSMSSASSLESQVLLAVGRARLKQMEQICASYERQLVNCDAELTRAMQSTYVALAFMLSQRCLLEVSDLGTNTVVRPRFTKECLDKIAASEAREREHEQEKVSRARGSCQDLSTCSPCWRPRCSLVAGNAPRTNRVSRTAERRADTRGRESRGCERAARERSEACRIAASERAARHRAGASCRGSETISCEAYLAIRMCGSLSVQCTATVRIGSQERAQEALRVRVPSIRTNHLRKLIGWS